MTIAFSDGVETSIQIDSIRRRSNSPGISHNDLESLVVRTCYYKDNKFERTKSKTVEFSLLSDNSK